MGVKVAVVSCENYHRESIELAIRKAVNLLGGISKFIKPGKKVLVKPNLCLAEPPYKCLTTHPEVVRAITLLGIEAGSRVVVGDNPVGDADRSRLNHIWESSGIASVLEGIDYERSFLDKEIDAFVSRINQKDYNFYMSRDIFSMDCIINTPKFKTHSLMTFTGAVKNLYGLLPGNSKRILHSELPVQADFASLLTEIYRLVSPGLNIMDAVIGIEGDGPGAQGIRRKIGLIMASEDGIALDSVAAKLMNIEPSLIHTNRIGTEKGIGESRLEQIEIVGESLEGYIMKDFKYPVTFRYNPDITHKIFNLSRAVVQISAEKCKTCGLCIPNCPVDSISISEGTAKIDQSTCISCMTCHEICPEAAVFAKRSSFYKQLARMRDQRIKQSETCVKVDDQKNDLQKDF